jgi:hypothetical protein
MIFSTGRADQFTKMDSAAKVALPELWEGSRLSPQSLDSFALRCGELIHGFYRFSRIFSESVSSV